MARVWFMLGAFLALGVPLRGISQTQPSTRPTTAVELYVLAHPLLKVDCPSSSNLTYQGYPPFPEAWQTLAKAAWEQNAPARELVHQAWFINRGGWPDNDQDLRELNVCRSLANEVCDAALYQHLQSDHAGAIASISDIMHMADLLEESRGSSLNTLVGTGIYAMLCDRLMVITSGVKLTTDADDRTDLQVSIARGLIQQLLNLPDPKDRPVTLPQPSMSRFVESVNRVNMERACAAMSLACHIFQFEKGRWPNSLDELIPDYLPSVPIDPWGDGKQTFGYVLIKFGLPDGSDRPLVYGRFQSPDGLMYRYDGPQYSLYNGDGSKQPSALRKHAGQFRDVARWAPTIPVTDASPEPTLRPLPQP